MSSEDFNFNSVIPDTTQEIAINEDKAKEDFLKLYSLNVNDKTESKNGLTYLSWPLAWAEFKKVFPTAEFRILRDPKTNLPYFTDPNDLGTFVFTEVKAGGLTYEMFLPVLSNDNKPMKLHSYTYEVFDKRQNKTVQRTVPQIDSFSISKSLVRCLVKNLSLFGLCLYIFAGEDMPEQISAPVETIENLAPTDISNVPFLQDDQPQKQTRRRKSATPPADPFASIKTIIANTESIKELVDLYLAHKPVVDAEPSLLEAFTQRKLELNSNAA